MFLLQFDACNRDNNRNGSIGYVLYYDNIVVYKTYEKLELSYNSNYAEYKALIKGLKFAKQLNIYDLFVEGDAKIVIDQINNICTIKNELILPLYKEVLNLKNSFDFINFEHIYRKYNIYADSLANHALIN